MTPHQPRDSHDPDEVPDEVEAGLAFAYGEGAEVSRAPSVLERLAEQTGTRLGISLRDADPADATPMLRPLSGDEPRRTGKYVVQGELGRGGVGAVHRGHDQELGRDVALKFLQEKYQDEPEILQRFVEEAQIGGQLQHPGIVPVYDLGLAKGRPFFAMKLVRGETLAKRLAERESPATDRRTFLSIFEDVCQTVAYAHARGVVHRDLKPANVMIGSFGEVQVVDWGMGKVLRQGGVADEGLPGASARVGSTVETVRSKSEGTASVIGSVMGTPAYMPPEQARGDVEAMDERSDVFALGAILCEILTGQPPYVGERDELIVKAATAELADAHERLAACRAEPELVEIAMRCLRPARAARPRNGEIVAHAIHEHLAAAEARVHDARVDAAAARVRAAALKRTQTLGIGLIAAILIGLVATVGLWRAAAAATERETLAHAAALASADLARANAMRAERELERAVEIKRLITGMLQSVTPEEALLTDTTLMKGLLDDAAGRLAAGLLDDELVAAELHHIVGDTYRTLALYDAAERHLPLALEIRERILGERHDDTLAARKARAHLHYARGRYAEAEADLRAVLNLHACSAESACAVARGAQQLLASTAQAFGRFDEAERLYVDVLEVQADVLGTDAIETQETRLGLGLLLLQRGQHDEGERALRGVLDIGEQVLGEQHPHSVRAQRSLAALLAQEGRYDEALLLYAKCIETSVGLWGPAHAETLLAQQELAVVHVERGQFAEAERLFLETRELQTAVLGKDHPAALTLAANLAAMYLESGRLDDAERIFLDVLEAQRRVLGDESPHTLTTLSNVAALHFYRGRLREAERLCSEVLETQERIAGPEHTDNHSRLLAARIFASTNRFDEAEQLLLDLLEARGRKHADESPETLLAIEALASDYNAVGRVDEAEELFVEALDGWERLLGEQNPAALFVRINLGLLRLARDRSEHAEADLLTALESMEQALGTAHPHTLIALENLGQTYAMIGRYEDAIDTLEPRLAAMRQTFGPDHEQVFHTIETLASSHLALGYRAQAVPLFGELVTSRVTAAEGLSDDPQRWNEAAWTLLTHELDELHDPTRARALAERACSFVEGSEDASRLWIYLDTLALAQHRMGATQVAAETQRRAVTLMPTGADPGALQRLAEYEAVED